MLDVSRIQNLRCDRIQNDNYSSSYKLAMQCTHWLSEQQHCSSGNMQYPVYNVYKGVFCAPVSYSLWQVVNYL